MLVLSRERNEEIVIGENIVVAVVEIRGNKARIGITAPRDVAVHRREVFEAIKRKEQETMANTTQELEQAQMHDVVRPKPMNSYSITAVIDGGQHGSHDQGDWARGGHRGDREAVREHQDRFAG